MTARNQTKLIQSYKKYRSRRTKKTTVLAYLRSFMPEIIFRTTKLEGESVTRKLVRSLFQ
ncbi:hypothetical protein HY409_00515 [Candidatus Gottesmanbacteria bacterium]|nr:hypothetical protein [Candidatus Gottesmanbacteria bacterium]